MAYSREAQGYIPETITVTDILGLAAVKPEQAALVLKLIKDLPGRQSRDLIFAMAAIATQDQVESPDYSYN